MKLRCPNRRNHALTLFQVLVVIASLLVIVAILLPALAAAKKKSSKIGCVNNLKQVGLAFRIWAGNNFDKYPMEVSMPHGGTMELMNTPDAWKTFQVMSNELSTPKILICPQDNNHTEFATNFATDLINKISYFIGLDATVTNETVLLSGDDNFEISGVPVKSGLMELSTNTPVAWSTARHNRVGNLGFADCSVQQVSTSGLKHLLQQTDLATNRLAIP